MDDKRTELLADLNKLNVDLRLIKDTRAAMNKKDEELLCEQLDLIDEIKEVNDELSAFPKEEKRPLRFTMCDILKEDYPELHEQLKKVAIEELSD